MDKNKPHTPQLSEWRTHSVYGGSLQPAPQRTRAVFATEVTSNLCCYRHVKRQSCRGPSEGVLLLYPGSLQPVFLQTMHTPHTSEPWLYHSAIQLLGHLSHYMGSKPVSWTLELLSFCEPLCSSCQDCGCLTDTMHQTQFSYHCS